MKIKKILAIALTFITALGLSSCYDDREINETGYIIALGVDKSRDDLYNYTFQLSNPLSMSTGGEDSGGGGDGGSEGKGKKDEEKPKIGEIWDKNKIKESTNANVFNIVVEAPDFYIAINLLNNFLSKDINMAHLKIIVFSQEVATEGLNKHIQLLIQEREVRPNTNLAIAKNSAEEFLKSVNPKLEKNTSRYYESLTKGENLAYAPMVEIRDFSAATDAIGMREIMPMSGVSPFGKSAEFEENSSTIFYDKNNLARLTFNAGEINRLSEEKSEFIGMAIFNNAKMIGSLDASGVQIYKLLYGNLSQTYISMKDENNPDGFMTFKLTKNKNPKYKVIMEGDRPNITVNLSFNVEFMGKEEAQSAEDFDKLKNYIKSALKQEFSDFLYMTARDYNSDIIGISRFFKKSCLTWSDWENVKWDDKYKNAGFNIDIDLKIKHSGKITPLNLN